MTAPVIALAILSAVLLIGAAALVVAGIFGFFRFRRLRRFQRLDADYRAAALVINTRRELAARAHRAAEDCQ